MQGLFVSLDESPSYNTSILNKQFAEIISYGVRNILKNEMIDDGHLIPI